MKAILLFAAFFCFLNLVIAQPGQLDPSFGNNGIVRTDLGASTNVNEGIGRQVLTATGGINYLIFQQYGGTVITRLLDNGSVDTSYGVNGYSQSASINSKVVGLFQKDGKIVLVGDQSGYFTVARFNTDGILDTTFAGDGQQTTNLRFDALYQLTAKINEDGKIVVAGCFGNEGDDYFLCINRYNTDGSPDTTFSEDGEQVTYAQFIFVFSGMAMQSDGKIIVAGYAGVPTGTGLADIIQRYNTDGSIDSTFSGDGYQEIDFATGFVAIQDDGKIIVGPRSSINPANDFPIARYNTDGTPDTAFSNDGKQTVAFLPVSATMQGDGKIVLAGSSDNNFAVARYNSDGTPDTAFGKDGKQTTDFESGTDNAYNAAIQNDGKIVLVGRSGNNFAVARYNPDGSPDNTFSEDGKLTGSFHTGNTVFKSIAVQKDGKAVSAGRTWNGSNFDFAVTRYNTDGSLDSAFSGDGIQTTNFTDENDYAKSVIIQGDGKIVVVGLSGAIGRNSKISIARYNSNGRLDKTFSYDGKLQSSLGYEWVNANSAAIQSDGRIVVAGEFGVARYNADGSLDLTFGKDGKQTDIFDPIEYFGVYSHPVSIAIQSDDKIVVGGISSGSEDFFNVARLNTDGSRDNTFKQNYSNSRQNVWISLAIQNDGKILVGGHDDYRGENRDFFLRKNTDGKYDKSNGIELEYEAPVHEDFWPSIAVQKDGKIVVSGVAVTRYTADGRLDSTFADNGILTKKNSDKNEFINAIAIADDKLYGVGYTKFPGNVGFVARYFLNEKNDVPPTVSLTAPSDNANYIAPVNLQLAATAADADGTITKVEFYTGSTLLYTDSVAPYTFTWGNTPVGNYTLSAKATDNSGLATISAPVNITVVSNKAPIVSITNPVNNRTFAAPAYIHFEAVASDTDGKITRVEIYSGTTLLATEYKAPYKYVWKNLTVGIYTVTAVATDNWGAQTMSAPVTVKVKAFSTSIVSSKSISETNDLNTKTAISLKAWPNPANKTVTISTNGLQQNKSVTLSIISISGIVLKKMQTRNSTTQLDISSLTSGVYTIKLLCGDKVLYKQFVKL